MSEWSYRPYSLLSLRAGQHDGENSIKTLKINDWNAGSNYFAKQWNLVAFWKINSGKFKHNRSFRKRKKGHGAK